MLIVESEEHAVARGAPILGRVMGGAVRSDSYDAVKSDPTGEQDSDAIVHAIEFAGLSPADIDMFNADAAGTKPGTSPRPRRSTVP